MAKDKYKYDKIYGGDGVYSKNGKIDTDNTSRKNYGHENNGKKFLRFIIKDLKPESIVDVGCGHNEFCQMLRQKLPIAAVGVDCSCPSADIQADADNLPFEDESFDLLTSFDMLEHIPPDEIDKVLSEFKRVSKRFLLQISLRQAPSRIDGEILHPIVKPADWWMKKLEEFGAGIVQITYYKGRRMVVRQKAKRFYVYGEFLK